MFVATTKYLNRLATGFHTGSVTAVTAMISNPTSAMVFRRLLMRPPAD